MDASYGLDYDWKREVRDPLLDQWEPPMAPRDPVPIPYEIPQGPCDPLTIYYQPIVIIS